MKHDWGGDECKHLCIADMLKNAWPLKCHNSAKHFLFILGLLNFKEKLHFIFLALLKSGSAVCFWVRTSSAVRSLLDLRDSLALSPPFLSLLCFSSCLFFSFSLPLPLYFLSLSWQIAWSVGMTDVRLVLSWASRLHIVGTGPSSYPLCL